MQIIYFILLLGLVIIIHELGHLLVAKAFGVYCGEFAIGMGPKLYSYQGKETVYSIRAVPIGGFVTMAGDDFEEEALPKERTLPGIHPWKRMIIMMAGVIMNFLLAWVLMSSIVMINGSVTIAPEPVIAGIMENSPAEIAGLQEGDRIVSVEYSDGTIIKPRDFYDVLNYNSLYTDERSMTVERNGALLTVTLTPLYYESEQSYLLGINIPPSTVRQIDFFDSFGYGMRYTADIVTDTISALGRIIRGIGLNQLSGPIGIFNITGEVMAQAQSFSEGVKYFFNLAAIMSANLAVFNVLPIPIMDGGRVLIILIEMIIRRPLNERLQNLLMAGSMALLLMLMVFIAYQDILNIFN